MLTLIENQSFLDTGITNHNENCLLGIKKEENYRLLDLLFVFLLDFLPAERFLFLAAAFLAFSAAFRFLVRAAFLAVARRCAFVCTMFRMNCT